MSQSPQRWSGEMLDDPEMVEAYTMQLRGVLSEHAERVARIRRDAEAMWQANPPAGYSSFEAWWRHRWLTGPFREIQEHLEAAAALTFKLEARYRRGRHEIPAERQAARTQAEARPALGRGAAPARQAADAPNLPTAGRRPSATSFLDAVREGRSA